MSRFGALNLHNLLTITRNVPFFPESLQNCAWLQTDVLERQCLHLYTGQAKTKTHHQNNQDLFFLPITFCNITLTNHLSNLTLSKPQPCLDILKKNAKHRYVDCKKHFIFYCIHFAQSALFVYASFVFN